MVTYFVSHPQKPRERSWLGVEGRGRNSTGAWGWGLINWSSGNFTWVIEKKIQIGLNEAVFESCFGMARMQRDVLEAYGRNF